MMKTIFKEIVKGILYTICLALIVGSIALTAAITGMVRTHLDAFHESESLGSMSTRYNLGSYTLVFGMNKIKDADTYGMNVSLIKWDDDNTKRNIVSIGADSELTVVSGDEVIFNKGSF